MKSRFNSDRYLQLAFASAMAILILVIVLYYRSMAVSRDSEAWVQHSHRVSSELDGMLYAMTNIDASGRAYLTTGAEPYLDSWRTGSQPRGCGTYRCRNTRCTWGASPPGGY